MIIFSNKEKIRKISRLIAKMWLWKVRYCIYKRKKNHLDTKIGFLKDTLRYFLFVVKSKKEGIQKINESV